MTRVLWVALVLCSCGNHQAAQTTRTKPPPADAGVVAPADAAALDQDLPRLATRVLKLYQDVAAAFAAVGEDCAAATQKLGELHGQYADVVAANAKVMHDGRAQELRAALAPHSAQVDAAAQAMFSAKTLPKCAQDATFAHAYDALFEEPP